MRKILFRGKRVDTGEWIYGDLIYNIDAVKIREQEQGIQRVAKSYAVIPKTVGQDIGSYDITGKTIFEDDIVEYIVPENDIAVTKWTDVVIYGDFFVCESEVGIAIRVIGNIHDNPELLEGEKT